MERLNKLIPAICGLVAALLIGLVSYYLVVTAPKPPSVVLAPNTTTPPEPGVEQVHQQTPSAAPADIKGHKDAQDDKAMAFTYADERLQSWLENWAATHKANDLLDKSQMDTLHDILNQSPLSAGDLMTVAHGYNKKSGAPMVASQIYRGAAAKMDREILQPAQETQGRLDAATAFTKHRQNIKDVLWPLIEGGQDPTALDTLYALSSDFLKYTASAPKDARRSAVAQSVRISLAGCLYEKGKLDQALTLVEQSNQETLTGERRASLEWVWASILYAKERYGDAVPHLEIVIQDEKFAHCQEAMEMLIRAECKAEKRDDAERLYHEYLERFKPDLAETVSLAAAIEKAK